MTELVNIDNFRAAETARMFDNTTRLNGGRTNTWYHFREPAPVDDQPVIRFNRDTLYSAAIVDISEGATVTVPDAGDRYLSVMALNAEHYVNRVFSEPGTYELTVEEHETPFINLSARIFADPNSASDLAEVNRLQDQLALTARAARPYEHTDYDVESLDATRELLLRLGEGIADTEQMFGSRSEVEPTRHLIGTAVGWGGLPVTEAYYYLESVPRDVGRYTITVSDVPVDGFWSVTIYNAAGLLEPNRFNAYSINGVTAAPEPDGSVVLNLAPTADGLKNHLYVMDGWNYAFRLYRPHGVVLDKTWTPPTPHRVD